MTTERYTDSNTILGVRGFNIALQSPDKEVYSRWWPVLTHWKHVLPVFPILGRAIYSPQGRFRLQGTFRSPHFIKTGVWMGELYYYVKHRIWVDVTGLTIGWSPVRCSWTVYENSCIVHECSWIKRLWTFMNVHQSVYELFMNIYNKWDFHEFINFFCSWTLTLFMNLGCSWAAMISDNS